MAVARRTTGKYQIANVFRVESKTIESDLKQWLKDNKEIFRYFFPNNPEEFLGFIKCIEIRNKKFDRSTLSKAKFEKIRKEREYEGDWKWDNDSKKYVCDYPILGEYDPIEKKVILYVKNIEDVCARYGVPFYCGVLATFIHELFHAVHHVAADNGKRPYNPIKEIEEAMTEFSTLVFLKEMVDAKPESDEWRQTFDWAQRSIRIKQYCLGDLPAYGFGYLLFNTLCKNIIRDDQEAANADSICGANDSRRNDPSIGVEKHENIGFHDFGEEPSSDYFKKMGDAIIEKYAKETTGDLGEFVRKCRDSVAEIKSVGTATQAIGDDAYEWIERYNQIIGAIDKNRYDVKRYQKMLNPVYPIKDEKLCMELLHGILFNL